MLLRRPPKSDLRAASQPEVTSDRLSGDARVQNRLFPKMHSWIALGTPLELLSPLSVLRLTFPCNALLWIIEISWLHWAGERRGWMYAIAGSAVVVWLALLCVRRVTTVWCHLLAALGTAMVAGLVWAANGPEAALGFLPFVVPQLVFVAVFLSVRAVFAHLALTAALLWAALSPTLGVSRAALVAVMTALAVSGAPLAAVLLATIARRNRAIDPDTGLPNALGLARRFASEHTRAPILLATVVLAGIDEAREALGHDVGTELLRRAVEDLGQVLPPKTLIARVDGDELVVRHLLPRAEAGNGAVSDRTTVPPDVREAAHALTSALVDAVAAGRYEAGRVEVSLRAHVGLVFSPWDGTHLAELLRRASLSARQASASGRVAVEWHHPGRTLTGEDLALLADLRTAGERGELHLAYQPQFEARTSRMVSTEALLRWKSPVHGDVRPVRIIGLAERTGYIDRLTEWVLSEALDAQVRWRQSGVTVPVSVNFSAKTLRRPDLPVWILRELEVRDLPPSALAVEVTETAAAELLPAVRLLQPLHDRGIRVSIDDFGTGYTSLAVLPHLPLDELKVDMSFVLRSGDSPADESIVRSVVELAHRLGLDAVAEGVENGDIRDRMTAFGYDLLQGFHLAKPLREEDFLAFARSAGTASVVG